MPLMQSPTVLQGNNTIPGVKIPDEVLARIPETLDACRNFGLDFYDTIIEFLNYDEISEIAAYGGFPVRYPHWQWGEQYEQLSKGFEHGQHRIYEMVVNCLSPNTLVTTDQGTKTIGEVKVGDVVLSGKGKRNVVHVKKNKPSSVVKLKLKHFATDTVCTPDHKWNVLRGSSPEWVMAKDLKSGDVIIAGGRYQDFLGVATELKWDEDKVYEETRPNVRWKLRTDVSYPKFMTRDFAELLGVISGDGSCGTQGAENTVVISIDKKLHDYHDHVSGLFEKVFNVKPLVYHKEHITTVQICSKAVISFLNSIGLKKGSTFNTKRIPSCIWESSNEYRARYLRGLFDTDGCVSGHLSMSCKNEDLASDVQKLLLDMGVRSKVTRIKNEQNDISSVVISGRSNAIKFNNLIGFSLSYKAKQLEQMVSRNHCISGGFALPELQEQLETMIKVLPKYSKLPIWIKRFRYNLSRKTFHINAMWSSVNRLIKLGYSQFDDMLTLLETPMYEVVEVENLPDKIETIDISLDHKDHDFLANGLWSHNCDPCYIYCLDSNTVVDNITVIAHATGHNDFFKNNVFFAKTSKNMINTLANHGSRIRRYMSEWGKENVGRFIDKVLSIETLIDPSSAWVKRRVKEPLKKTSREYHHPRRLNVDHDYMEDWINTPEWIKEENERIRINEIKKSIGLFEKPQKDVFKFLKDCAPLKPWQQDVMAMLYEETIYFAPQRQTKVANEGFACISIDNLINTNQGFMRPDELVNNKAKAIVHDGESRKEVSNWFTFEKRQTRKIRTWRGYEIEGSDNHRVMLLDGEWKKLGDMQLGDKVKLAIGTQMWAEKEVEVTWKPLKDKTIPTLLEELGISRHTFYKWRNGETVTNSEKIQKEWDTFNEENNGRKASGTNRRFICSIPKTVNEDFASFLGYLIGDGFISKKAKQIGIASGDKDQADKFESLAQKLFGVKTRKFLDVGRWRVHLSSRYVEDFLLSLGLTFGFSARTKKVPNVILKSPKNVQAAFLRCLFDADGYAGDAGVILSSTSTRMAKTVQTMLLNFGILSNRRLSEADECWQVKVGGSCVRTYMKEIGFNLERKTKKGTDYIENHYWFKEKDEDYVVMVEDTGIQTVYDISVEETHRYAAQGFINHNSYVDSQIMARFGLAQDEGIFEYAAHKAGVLGGKTSMNPYKLGYMLLLDIEDRWNKGKFGKEYDECQDSREKENWDKKLGLGHDKVFEVRAFYDDVTLISEFFTQEFCDKYEFFHWQKFPDGTYKIADRDAKNIKKHLIQSRLNGGLPEIYLADPNYQGKRIFLLEHKWDGRMLHPGQTKDTLRSVSYLWNGPVALITKDKDQREVVYHCDDDKIEVRYR